MDETGEPQSKPAAIESFSYSWLNSFPSSETLTDTFDDSSSSSYIEFDPTLPPSGRFSEISFEFEFGSPVSRHTLFHADELFRDGHVIPFFAGVGSNSDDPGRPGSIARESSRRFRRLPVGVFMKSFDFFRRMFGGGRRRRGRKGKNGNSKGRVHSEETSRRISVDCRRRSCDSESSIYEAVLHCKKSFGN